MCRVVALLALLQISVVVPACSSRAIAPPPAPGPADASAATYDLSSPPSIDDLSQVVVDPPDLLSLIGVACGPLHCAQDADQFCDTADYGITGACHAHVSATAKPFGCDGPEDCPSGACCMTPDGSACSAFGFCVSGNVKGRYMCHGGGSDYCGKDSLCCPLAPGSPYEACLDQVSLCP